MTDVLAWIVVGLFVILWVRVEWVAARAKEALDTANGAESRISSVADYPFSDKSFLQSVLKERDRQMVQLARRLGWYWDSNAGEWIDPHSGKPAKAGK